MCRIRDPKLQDVSEDLEPVFRASVKIRGCKFRHTRARARALEASRESEYPTPLRTSVFRDVKFKNTDAYTCRDLAMRKSVAGDPRLGKKLPPKHRTAGRQLSRIHLVKCERYLLLKVERRTNVSQSSLSHDYVQFACGREKRVALDELAISILLIPSATLSWHRLKTKGSSGRRSG